MRKATAGYTTIAALTGIMIAVGMTIGISALNGHLHEALVMYQRLGEAFASLAR